MTNKVIQTDINYTLYLVVFISIPCLKEVSLNFQMQAKV